MLKITYMRGAASDLRNEINEILKIDREELYGEKRLHEISFKNNGKEQFEMTFKLIEDLSKYQFDRIPKQFIDPIIKRLQRYKDIFEKAKNLNLHVRNPTNSRDQIIQEIENEYDGFFEEVSKIIGFANQTGTDFKQIEEEARQTLESFKSQVEEKNKQIEKNLQESNNILDSMRSASAETGVSQNAIHYSNAREDHANRAKKWYKWGKWLLITLIIATISTGIAFVCFKESDQLTLGYFEIAAIVVFSLWVYAINFCNKNFHAEKHNEMINANKARTLTTFRSFVESTEDENIKNQVLLYASTSAFSNPSTGFGKNQSPPLPPGIELIKQTANSSIERS